MQKIWYDFENSSNITLTKRLPLIIKSSIRGVDKYQPYFDETFIEAFNAGIAEALKQFEGAVTAFRCGESVIFIIRNDWSYNTTPWFNNSQQKINSVATSILTKSCDLIFETNVFVLPSLHDAIKYISYHQQESRLYAVSELLSQQLKIDNSDEEAFKISSKGSLEEKIELLNKFEIDLDTLPSNIFWGTIFYKVKRIVKGDNYRLKWYIDNNVGNLDSDNAFLSDILLTGSDIIRPERDL